MNLNFNKIKLSMITICAMSTLLSQENLNNSKDLRQKTISL